MSDNILVVTFEGPQTIEKADLIKEQLLTAVQGKKNEILINFSGIKKVDLSFLQLLHAAVLEADKSKKNLSLTGSVPESLVDSVKLAGYDKNLIVSSGDIFSQIVNGGENS